MEKELHFARNLLEKSNDENLQLHRNISYLEGKQLKQDSGDPQSHSKHRLTDEDVIIEHLNNLHQDTQVVKQ